jgi:hemolysin activation/secretion protein
MGGSTLRGFQDREFRGDTRILARQDLLVRLFKQKHFSVFGSTFYDVGFIYHDDDGPGRKSVRNGVGAGLKVSLPDVIAPVFGMDAGYGIEDHGFHLYFALGLVQ